MWSRFFSVFQVIVKLQLFFANSDLSKLHNFYFGWIPQLFFSVLPQNTFQSLGKKTLSYIRLMSKAKKKSILKDSQTLFVQKTLQLIMKHPLKAFDILFNFY